MGEVFTIPAGTPLYHGTALRFDERSAPLAAPAWLGFPWDEAATYRHKGATRQDPGDPRIIRFLAAREISLSGAMSPVSMDEQLADAAAAGHDGAIIDFRAQGMGLFVILADPGAVLVHNATFTAAFQNWDWDAPEATEPSPRDQVGALELAALGDPDKSEAALAASAPSTAFGR